MQSPDMQKLKREDYPEYQKKYLNQKMKSIQWYCDVCKNGKKLFIKEKMVTFKG